MQSQAGNMAHEARNVSSKYKKITFQAEHMSSQDGTCQVKMVAYQVEVGTCQVKVGTGQVNLGT